MLCLTCLSVPYCYMLFYKICMCMFRSVLMVCLPYKPKLYIVLNKSRYRPVIPVLRLTYYICASLSASLKNWSLVMYGTATHPQNGHNIPARRPNRPVEGMPPDLNCACGRLAPPWALLGLLLALVTLATRSPSSGPAHSSKLYT